MERTRGLSEELGVNLYIERVDVVGLCLGRLKVEFTVLRPV
jgi:1-aminocyclopropane-1-carboxylate deaminase/D-cysteine desulfhydrase-like pyridoxal-dependent ACC family enzyme